MTNLEELVYEQTRPADTAPTMFPRGGSGKGRQQKGKNPLWDEEFGGVRASDPPGTTQVSKLTHILGHFTGLLLWVGLWGVGAFSTVYFFNSWFPATKVAPWNAALWALCIGISMYERAEMPPMGLLWANPFHKNYIKSQVPLVTQSLLDKKTWILIIGLDVGSTFGGAYVFLAGKSITFFIWTLDFHLAFVLIPISLLIGLVCAIGPEPKVAEHLRKLKRGLR